MHVAWKSVMSHLRRLVFVVKRPLNGFGCLYVLAPSGHGGSLLLWGGGGVVFSSGLLVNNLLHKLCPILLQQSHATVIRWTGEADHSKQRMRQLNDGTITHVDCARRKRDSGSPNATINLRPMPEAQRERKTRLLLLLCIFLRWVLVVSSMLSEMLLPAGIFSC